MCGIAAGSAALAMEVWISQSISRGENGICLGDIWGGGRNRPGEVGGEQLTHHLGPHKVQGWVHTLVSRASEGVLQASYLSIVLILGFQKINKPETVVLHSRYKASSQSSEDAKAVKNL